MIFERRLSAEWAQMGSAKREGERLCRHRITFPLLTNKLNWTRTELVNATTEEERPRAGIERTTLVPSKADEGLGTHRVGTISLPKVNPSFYCSDHTLSRLHGSSLVVEDGLTTPGRGVARAVGTCYSTRDLGGFLGAGGALDPRGKVVVEVYACTILPAAPAN